MMRHRYGYNCQVVQQGGLNEVVPLFYMEVVPGETVGGTVSTMFRSGPVNTQIDTRAYADVFAFYVPFRLMFETWPQFISSGGTDGGPLPLVTDLFPGNFESRFSIASGGTTYDRNVAWQRYAYNMVWNKFFRNEWDAERAPTATGIAYARQRPSTLETSNMDSTAQITQDTLIGLSGTSPNQTLSLASLRAGISTDIFNKMRTFYGKRYIDYLAALGVNTQWSVLDEPETLGAKHTDWRFQTTKQTSPATTATPPNQVVVGSPAGQFASTVKLNLKKTFVPEHGLLCAFGVTRSDSIYGEAPQPVHLGKNQATQYWSPELSVMQAKALPAQSFGNYLNVASSPTWAFPQWEEYRKGMNYNRTIVVNNRTYGLVVTTPSTDVLRYQALTPAQYDPNFPAPVAQQYAATTQLRLIRNSPVRRVDPRLKLS